MESKRRSLAKALSWRVFATLITGFVAYFITGEIAFAVEIGVLDTSIKFATYYAHERAWLKIPYGRPPAGQDYQI